MTYVLEDLLDIRKHREETAMSDLQRCIQTVKDCRLSKEQKSKALEEFTAWREDEEQRLFEELRVASRNIDDLIKFNFQIEALRNEQAQLQAALDQAEAALREAERKNQEAKDRYLDAHRETEKLESHKSIWLQEKYLQDERMADEEMDEMSLTRINRSPVL